MSLTKARKNHLCDECLRRIPAGRLYFRQTTFHDGLQVYKAHKICSEIAFVINQDYGSWGEWFCIHESTRMEIIEFYLEARAKREHNKDKEDYGLVLS